MKKIALLITSIILFNQGFSIHTNDNKFFEATQLNSKNCRYAHEVGHNSFSEPEMNLACKPRS
ncbi:MULTISPECIES: hypothetical protein [Francisella]|uniref:Uncharacterized protein n=2 Tax=Francisella TaxID=262 RepID=A0AAJ4NQJ7_9GAMM|nr:MULTISPECIES: hypothetical protein [Francisella]QEO56814.1 hypothetical protein F0R74_02745 [Francisella marina]QEO59067.1 hypothetical protein F0R75_04480 [Francisella marina]QWV00119.1 hypothetical protein KQR59_04355 [Francisella salimarina]